MKTNKIALVAAASLLALGSTAWAHGSWSNSGQASSGSAYATPGTTVFTGNTVTPVHDNGLSATQADNAMPVVSYQSTTVYTAPGTTAGASASGSDMSSGSGTGVGGSTNAPVVGVSTERIVGYALPDQTVNRNTVHDDAAAFARVRANASGESPDYPDRVQRFLGTAPGSHDVLNNASNANTSTSTSGTGSGQ